MEELWNNNDRGFYNLLEMDEGLSDDDLYDHLGDAQTNAIINEFLSIVERSQTSPTDLLTNLSPPLDYVAHHYQLTNVLHSHHHPSTFLSMSSIREWYLSAKSINPKGVQLRQTALIFQITPILRANAMKTYMLYYLI
ncbi:hypothetical protein TorRG33x02_244820 [Trema orientale]|uniref:Uncharacterized protein n=1 Tax=Trema orientale TaxID=63057 RepID=A0A2P5DQQ7_TREOI|nr:hypothetical protein TorRG33x02_244820 [Trema orientale]